LIETLLLLVTCVWIIYEAIKRLFFEDVEVDASVWAFLVMGASIVIDFSRSRVLMRAARKHNSQALEADALHFSTDILSSSVVILGLFGVLISEKISQLEFLAKTDSLAALIVALIVIVVSYRLGRRSIRGLLDSAPDGLADNIERTVEAIPGVLECHQVRVRTAGPQTFVDIHVVMDGALSLEKAHQLTELIEKAVQQMAFRADVTVHAEPLEPAKP